MTTTVAIAVAHRRTAIAFFLTSALTIAGCAQATGGAPPQTPSAPAAAETQKPATQGAAAAGTPSAPAAAAAIKPLIATSPDGTKIAYEKTGTGPALMLVHGGGQTRRSWNDSGYVDRLSKSFTVITVDTRGTGNSDRPTTAEDYALDKMLADLLAVADAASAPRFHLMAFGHGASISRHLAARSDRVISAVLIGADMGPTLQGPVKEAIAGMRAKWQPLLDAQKAGTLDLKQFSYGDREAWNNGIAISAVALGALSDYPALEPSEIKAPTLWLVGAADTSAMENAKAYQGKLAGTKVTFKEVSGLSYSDSFSKVDPVLAEAEPFLKGTAKPTS